MRYWDATRKKDMTIGIIGIGGLGSLGFQIDKSLDQGHKVIAIDNVPAKEDYIMNILGADSFVNSTNKAQIKAATSTMDLILNKIPTPH